MEKKLGYKVSMREGLPEEYYHMNIEGNDRQLAYELFKELKSGETYTVSIQVKNDFEKYEHIRTVNLYLGKVTPMIYKPIFPKKLSFWNRLKVFFTGDVPFQIGSEK